MLAVGEAASNAIEHPVAAYPHAIVVRARVTGDGAALIEVRDHGRWNEEPSEPHRGRGMAIMRAVAGDVGVERSSDGTTITIMRRLDQTTS